jgi:hypothetical protein
MDAVISIDIAFGGLTLGFALYLAYQIYRVAKFSDKPMFLQTMIIVLSVTFFNLYNVFYLLYFHKDFD